MLKIEEVEGLHLELTSKCNLNCLHCARTDQNTGKKIKTLPLQNLNPNVLEKVLKQLPQVKLVHCCGNYGDIMSYDKIFDILEIIESKNIPLARFYTNGSAKNSTYWKKLASKTKNYAEIIFSIDGLEDTNELYRKNSNWKKIITNLETFVKNGGNAIWEMLVFSHNQHQVQSAEKFAYSLGVKNFRVKKPDRFHLIDKKTVQKSTISRFQHIDKEDNNINCKYKKYKWLFLNFEGELMPCCWMGGDKYKINQITNNFYHFYLINQGYKTNADIYTVKEILSGKFFKELQKSWTKQNKKTNNYEQDKIKFDYLSDMFQLEEKTLQTHIYQNNYNYYESFLQKKFPNKDCVSVCSKKCRNRNTLENKYIMYEKS